MRPPTLKFVGLQSPENYSSITLINPNVDQVMCVKGASRCTKKTLRWCLGLNVGWILTTNNHGGPVGNPRTEWRLISPTCNRTPPWSVYLYNEKMEEMWGGFLRITWGDLYFLTSHTYNENRRGCCFPMGCHLGEPNIDHLRTNVFTHKIRL